MLVNMIHSRPANLTLMEGLSFNSDFSFTVSFSCRPAGMLEFSLFGIPYVSGVKTLPSVLTRPNPRRRDLGPLSGLGRSERWLVLLERLFDRFSDGAVATRCREQTFSGRL